MFFELKIFTYQSTKICIFIVDFLIAKKQKNLKNNLKTTNLSLKKEKNCENFLKNKIEKQIQTNEKNSMKKTISKNE